MNAIRIQTHIDSDILHLPELRPLIGKRVEIIVLEEPQIVPRTENDWKPLFELAGQDLVDPDAYSQLRAASMI